MHNGGLTMSIREPQSPSKRKQVLLPSVLLLTLFAAIIAGSFFIMRTQARSSQNIISHNNNQLIMLKEIRSQMALLTMWQYTLRSSKQADRVLALKEINQSTNSMKELATELHKKATIDTLYTGRLLIALDQVTDANSQIVNANKAYKSQLIIDSLTVDYQSIFNITNFHINTVEDLQSQRVKSLNEQRYVRIIQNIIIGIIIFVTTFVIFLFLFFTKRRAQLELQQAEAYLSDLFESMPTALIGINNHGRIVRTNSIANELAKESRSILGGELTTQFPFLSEEIEVLKTHLNSGENHSFECQSDELRLYQANLFPLKGGNQAGAVLRIEDITEASALKEELNQTKKMNAIGQLAGGIAHDFNNMLGGIMNATELLRFDCDPKEKKLFLDMIEETTKRASDLTQKLLTFARKNVHQNEPVNIHQIIKSTLDLLSHTLDKRITIVSNLHASQATVSGDRGQIQNIFLNLGINAGQAMSEGGTLVFDTIVKELDEAYCKSSTFEIKPGAYIMIEVSDSGTGISPQNMEHIFEPFFTTKGSGTGIGLASSLGTIQTMNGEIIVDSTLNRGTTFTILIPLELSGSAQSTDEVIEPVEGTGTILVVDDELIMRKSMTLILERLGYSVILAQNGLEGVERFREEQEKIDLIILDMIMPVMRGDQAMAKIREISSTVPVLICSGYSHSQDIQKVQELSIQGIISKPFQVNELSKIIHQTIGTVTEPKG